MSTPAPATSPPVHRFVIRPRTGQADPLAEAVQAQACESGLNPGRTESAKVYLIQAELTPDQLQSIEHELLVDPVLESAAPTEGAPDAVIEVHPLPGVMDPVAQSVAEAVEALIDIRPRVQTGLRYEFTHLSQAEARRFAESHLANPVIQHIHDGALAPASLPTGSPQPFKLVHVPIRDRSDPQLEQLSREGHLFLDLHEMQAIRQKYQQLGREPTDIELETLAQTWSEHCVHKTLKSTIRYTGPASDTIDWSNRPGHTINPDGSITIDNLLKSTVAAATFELIDEGLDWTRSVFVDNAGIIAFDDEHSVCAKVETHNHPSAIEPYGGAATGIGGCIRDIIGTGLAAKPIASTDVFCVAPPDSFSLPLPAGEKTGERGLQPLPAGCLPPGRVLSRVVAGVRDYGNRMGIPTVNGAVWFDDRYVGNPLVYCGCIGIMPNDKIDGDANPGDLIVALGGRTGRDGIHGATFSSAELTDTHADEFSHAVQIGNPIEEKRVLDAILRARDWSPSTTSPNTQCPVPDAQCLYSSITDCGAGGFSSAIGEMGERVGAEVHLDKAPLKYAGLTYSEIWISEAQERMILAVPRSNLEPLQTICDEEHVELAVLGTFGHFNADNEPELILNFQSTEVGRLPMPFLHDGIPTPIRTATWTSPISSSLSPSRDRAGQMGAPNPPPTIEQALLALLAHPNIASKRSIISQYDHEVQGNTVLKPMVGIEGIGPGDAAVIEPVPGSGRGLAIGCGLATNIGDPALGGDPYHMALAAIDECVRNLVCAGADPSRIAILDNFCWPSCNKPENMASLVRAAEGCYDGAKAYKTPFISGKDSLNNQFTTKDGATIEIPPTLLITGIGIVPDISKCVTMDVKRRGSSALIVGPKDDTNWRRLGGSHYAGLYGTPSCESEEMPVPDPEIGRVVASCIAAGIQLGLVAAAHDISDGGAAVAIAEMLIASAGSGMGFDASSAPIEQWFTEMPHRYIVQPKDEINFLDLLESYGVDWCRIGFFGDSNSMDINGSVIPVDELKNAWLGSVKV